MGTEGFPLTGLTGLAMPAPVEVPDGGGGEVDDPDGPWSEVTDSNGAAVSVPPVVDVEEMKTVDGPEGFELLLLATVPPTAPPTMAPMARMPPTTMMILHFF